MCRIHIGGDNTQSDMGHDKSSTGIVTSCIWHLLTSFFSSWNIDNNKGPSLSHVKKTLGNYGSKNGAIVPTPQPSKSFWVYPKCKPTIEYHECTVLPL